jgi:integrase
MLTEKQIQAAMRTVTSETVLNDSAAGRGGGSLRLRIRKGTKGPNATWFAVWWAEKKQASKTLGRYPDTGLADARRKYEIEVRDVLLAGRDPNAVIVQAELPTVEKLFQGYIQALRDKGSVTADEYERQLLTGGFNAVDQLGRAKIAAAVEPADIAAALTIGMKRGARRTTDQQRTAMAAAFTWGMKSTNDYTIEHRIDWGLKYNPVSAVPRDQGANRVRERNLTADEVRHVWNSAPDQTGDVLRLVLATGQRVKECLTVEGCDVDLKARLWTIPAPKTKGRKTMHLVPLTAQAVALFETLIALEGSGWLFPSRAGAKGPIIGIPSVSRGASRMEGIAKFQPRDLRRTWKSRAGDAGIDRFTRDLIQQHARTDTGSKHYDRYDYLPQMREAMGKWEAWLDQVLADKELLADIAA